MPNRRQFLQTGAAVSAMAANGMMTAAAAAAAAGTPRRGRLGRTIYDDRYAEGRRFAAVVAAQGVPTRALDDGDITRFWCDELDALWLRGPVAIAGFTQFGPMFVVERLGLERGMRLVLRVEHRDSKADGSLEHSFTGPRETLALAAGFETLHSDWPGLMAALACSVGGDDSARHAAALATSAVAPRLVPTAEQPSVIHYYTPLAVQQGYGPALDGPLYSWVVAPALTSSTR